MKKQSISKYLTTPKISLAVIIIIILTLLLATFHNQAKSQSFDGIPISGTMAQASARFKAKGYTQIANTPNQYIMFKGQVSNEEIQVMVLCTPKTYIVFTFGVYFDEKQTFSALKNDFNSLLETLTDKYGSPDAVEKDFDSPYYEGDGYEMTAVRGQKCTYQAKWNNLPNLSIRLLINKFGQVQINYYNTENLRLYMSERDDIQKKAFQP
jgi:hypothetical protein